MTYRYDFLVIGSGIAGMSFGLKVARYGRVAIVAKNPLKMLIPITPKEELLL